MRRDRDIVVLGGSAGATDAFTTILSMLPADFAGSIFVVRHRGPKQPCELLRQIIASRTCLPTLAAHDDQPIEAGHVYVAPADRHLLVTNGLIKLEPSPPEQRFRPCLDVAFKSAAQAYGRRVVGVLLTGRHGDDGAAGLWQVRNRGGVAIVQDPSDARYPGMPQAVLDKVAVDHVLPVAQIGVALTKLVSARADDLPAARPRILIVEDESIVAANLQQSLVEMGYDIVDWVPTGEAAIGVAEQQAPDLILMDIRLAGPLSGIETARRIWQQLQIPVVFCTAHTDLETLKSVQTAESYGYVVKPFQSAAVRATIELALARREKESR